MDFATGFAAGLIFGKKKFGGGGEEEWTPPADWPDVPEPGDYEMCFLIYSTSASNNNQVYFMITEPGTANTGEGTIVVDWGDGTTETINGTDDEGHSRSSKIYHTYENDGIYVVKFVTDKNNCFLQYTTGSILLIAKLGKNIVVNDGSKNNTQQAFYGQRRLQYVQLNGDGDLPKSGAFSRCCALRKVDMKKPPTVIHTNTFYGTYTLSNFDFSEVVSVEEQGMQSSGFEKIYMPKCTSLGRLAIGSTPFLKEIDLPNCITVGNSAFEGDYRLAKANLPKCEEMGDTVFSACNVLTELIVSSECNFGKNCFTDCYVLYPKPDGTL